MTMDAPVDAWSDTGYVTEIPYTRDYLRYQSPVKMAFAAASNGFAYPDYHGAFRYCDLGCGEAVTTICLAAAYPNGTFVGVDLNPEHIRNATALAAAAGLTNVIFLEADFADPRIALAGPYDFIGSHGVYSWVSPDVQVQMHQLLDRVLAPGGLYYFCHYVRPGGNSTEAMFQLVQSLMATQTGPVAQRVSQAVAALRQLYDQGAPFFENFENVDSTIRELESRDPRYLVHEFGNQFFNPRYMAEVSRDLARVGLRHVGTTRFDRNQVENLFAEGPPDGLMELDHPQREVRASLLSYDAFRWDVYQKTPVGAGPQDPAHMDGFLIDAANFPYAFPKSANLWERDVALDTPVFARVAELCRDGQKTVSEIIVACAADGFDAPSVRQIIRDMMGTWLFQPIVQAGLPVRTPMRKLYRFAQPLSGQICARDLLDEGRVNLASSIIGGAVKLDRFDSLAASAMIGRDHDGGRAALWAQLQGFDPGTRDRLKAHRYDTAADFDAAWAKFFRTTLPRLVKYDILTPDP